MKKNTMETIANFLNAYIEGNGMVVTDEVVDARNELVAELSRGAKKAQKNQELYAEAHDAVMAGLGRAVSPITVSELYEDIASELPEGFSKGKVQYALLHYWDGEVVKTKGDPNTYSLK